MYTLTFFFFNLVLLIVSIIIVAFVFGTATNTQSCLSSIIPISDLSRLHCLNNTPATSPLEILSLRPPEINSVTQSVVKVLTVPFGVTVSSNLIKSGRRSPSQSHLQIV